MPHFRASSSEDWTERRVGSSEMQLSQMDATPTRTVPVSLDSLEDRITSAGCNERSLSSYVKLHKPIRDSSMYSKHLFSYSENHHRSHSRVLTDEICYWIEHHQDLRLQSLFNYNGQTDGWTEGRGETLLFRRPFVQSQIGSSFPLCLSFLVCIPLTWAWVWSVRNHESHLALNPWSAAVQVP